MCWHFLHWQMHAQGPAHTHTHTSASAAGVAVFGLLNLLNAFWLIKLVRMALGSLRKANRAPGGAATGGAKAHTPSGGTVAAGQAAVQEGKLSPNSAGTEARHIVSVTANSHRKFD